MNITAVPTISEMVGVTRVLRGASVTNVLGDINLSSENERVLRRKYILRALEILRTDVKAKRVFTLEGTD